MKTFITYENIHHYTSELVRKVSAENSNIDYIVGISRGGLIPAVIMSHQMGLPLVPVQWSTRDHSQRMHNLTIAEDLQRGATILLVDDINDSGKTFLELIEDWRYTKESFGQLITASVFQRYSTSHPSDFYDVLVTDDSWLVFPYEVN